MTPFLRGGGNTVRTMTILLSAALLSTCGFLTDDVFPRWLSYVEASVDFRAIAAAQGLGQDAEIANLELAPYVTGGTDYSKVLVYATGNNASRLLLLDPETLDFVFSRTDVNFTRVLASVTGGFLCGTQVVNPADPGDALTNATAWTSANDVRVFRVGDHVTGLNYAVDPNSPQQPVFREYSDLWVAGAIATRSWDSANQGYEILDADHTNGYSVLTRYNYSNTGYAATYATDTDFTDNASFWVLDWGTATVTGPFPVSDSHAWLTEGGPVAYNRGDKGDDRLVRYEWGTGDFALGTQSTAIDSLVFEDDDVELLSFDPSGEWWYIYDRMDGRLYKLRTWWK